MLEDKLRELMSEDKEAKALAKEVVKIYEDYPDLTLKEILDNIALIAEDM